MNEPTDGTPSTFTMQIPLSASVGLTLATSVPLQPGQMLVLQSGTGAEEYLRVESVTADGQCRVVAVPPPTTQPLPWSQRLAKWCHALPEELAWHLWWRPWFRWHGVAGRMWRRTWGGWYRWRHRHDTDAEIVARFVERLREVFGERPGE